MKLTTNKEIPPGTFVPCSLTINFEKQEELDLLISLFNSGKVRVALDKISDDDTTMNIWKKLRDLGGNCRYTGKINDSLGR